MELPFLKVNPCERLMTNDKAEYLDKNSVSVGSSNLDDTTPSDSGVHMLDSESSELMIESITSQTCLDLDDTKFIPLKLETTNLPIITSNVAGLIDTNCNVTAAPDPAMTASQCSTFDTTENIVYRRKARKPSSVSKAPKKRVSFHEDILKNTRTDNIHIEHGFITYKSGVSKSSQANNVPGAVRYSWCYDGDNAEPTDLAQCIDSNSKSKRRLVYRNACSDVLDYGNSNVYDINDGNPLQYDQSGIFEYVENANSNSPPTSNGNPVDAVGENNAEPELYTCSCSSSDSSLDSDNNTRNRKQYAQAKSNSCDCIGMNNTNNNFIEENCYYSEPNMDCQQSPPLRKSVWNKEKKPKSSCLKKNAKFYPNYVVHEQDIRNKMKKFNVHDMNQLLDNGSKMIFGSLKSIFTMTLPERGVPEGSEDLNSVVECVLDCENSAERSAVEGQCSTPTTPTNSAVLTSPQMKVKPFLSKSLDGSKQQEPIKKFVHNVDEQLRHKNEQQHTEISNSNLCNINTDTTSEDSKVTDTTTDVTPFRNKFIINCESTVFEHTGVSYSYETSSFDDISCMEDACGSLTSLMDDNAKNMTDRNSKPFANSLLTTTFTNFFRQLKDSGRSKTSPMQTNKRPDSTLGASTPSSFYGIDKIQQMNSPEEQASNTNSFCEFGSITSNSDEHKLNTSLTSGIASIGSSQRESISNAANDVNLIGQENSRHLPSPLRKRCSVDSVSSTRIIQQSLPQRYARKSTQSNDKLRKHFSSHLLEAKTVSSDCTIDGDASAAKSTTFSEEFDDIITITTDTDRNESDIVIVDYPEHNEYNNLLKAPASTSKASLINRFLRNVTQKKILESSIKRNNFFAGKLKSQQKFNLYVKGAKVLNTELVNDLNTEIALEMKINSPSKESNSLQGQFNPDFQSGLAEVSIDLFSKTQLSIIQEANEQLIKAYKLYAGYSREGYMTPVLVFLTDRSVYVCDLVRNRLCSKFILAYKDLDIILLGPYGSTVLLSNDGRDKQQILLAGGYTLAKELVANLEMCARRRNCVLPAVGELSLNHLTALQKFIRRNSNVGRADDWMLYTIVCVPGSSLGQEYEREPMGPHAKGFLMHRRIKDQFHSAKHQHQWSPGYFLLKAGVLYMFNDSMQKIPSWAMALAECQGARRAAKINRPHCFEIVLKDHVLLQLAAPDEYVASEWLQALLQSASGLFEMQEKHKTLGCTLVLTKHHLITLREDFSSPLKQVAGKIGNNPTSQPYAFSNQENGYQQMLPANSLLSSTMSTPTHSVQRSCSSINSTPTKLSFRSNTTFTSPSIISHITLTSNTSSTSTFCSQQQQAGRMYEQSRNAFSVYGQNAGLEILTCADIKELTGVKVSPAQQDACWCILEFSCQEVRESSDDLVLFFSSNTEKQEFLHLLEKLWQANNNDVFPLSIIDAADELNRQCSALNTDIKRSWEPLLSAALGYPL